jgi:hypothetical protein
VLHGGSFARRGGPRRSIGGRISISGFRT